MTNDATQRVFNFSAGPAVLPLPVLEQIQSEMLCLPGVGASILEISHRSKAFEAIHNGAIALLRELLAIPAGYTVLLLQGGARLQFSMLAMNLLRGQGKPADYVLTGSWGKSAHAEAVKEGEVRVAWDGKAENYRRLPAAGELKLSPDAAYVHVTSNETIQGVQFPTDLSFGAAPLVCDASSDFLSRPIPVEKYGLIYACAQKNAGPAGVTVVILREELLARSSDALPGYLNYKTHAGENSLWNTPPTFAIYVLGLVCQWLKHEVGGLTAMAERNHAKAERIYAAIDASGGFYRGHAAAECRSRMNATFRLPSEPLEAEFTAAAAKQGLTDLKGHRSVGGIRASIYNALPLAGVEALREFMLDFAAKRA